VSLHFFVNEVLMTLFFFVVGLEIRREAPTARSRSEARGAPSRRGRRRSPCA
jgi:Na+/H+ antiporter NhaA